jgi:hypothetical protein
MTDAPQVTQWEGDGRKRGIGGRDCVYCLDERYQHITVYPREGGICISITGPQDKAYTVIPKKQFREVVKWLKSWGYL